jgi:hypothetical protein
LARGDVQRSDVVWACPWPLKTCLVETSRIGAVSACNAGLVRDYAVDGGTGGWWNWWMVELVDGGAGRLIACCWLRRNKQKAQWEGNIAQRPFVRRLRINPLTLRTRACGGRAPATIYKMVPAARLG